jgi:[ribosomal protein S18]-alanine N-acetyltransferase
VRLRPAAGDDVDAISRLESVLFGADAWTPEIVRSEVTAPDRVALVAEGEGGDAGVAGYVVVRVGPDVADLHRIAVAPAARRRGLARRLLAEVGPVPRLLLEVSADNDEARAFYAAEGFTELARRRRYYRDGSDAVVMARPPRT